MKSGWEKRSGFIGAKAMQQQTKHEQLWVGISWQLRWMGSSEEGEA